MEEIRFTVQGSAEEPYRVTFRKKGNNLSAYCTCPAGENGQYCKHRFRILAGTKEGIISDNKDEVMIVKAWLPGTDVETALIEVAERERVHEKAKKDLSTAKKKLARAMLDWLPPYYWSKFVTCSSTDYLVVGEEPGSKLKKADALGVKKISYEELLKMIGGRGKLI